MTSSPIPFSSSPPAVAWIGLFRAEDQPVAKEMLDAMLLVSRDSFAQEMRTLILHRMQDGIGPIALYAERELPKRFARPHPLFKQTRTKVKRAFGVGPQPVRPTRAYDPEVGSEGLVAQLITELCREFPKTFLNHPGPDEIRKQKVRRFILVTDFIGSGQRAWTYLEAAWRVKSVASWNSLRKGGQKLMRFEVVAYSSTPAGQKRVEKHPCTPAVHVVKACPTIDTAFASDDIRRQVRSLCVRNDPVDHDLSESLGYKGSGALIAFAHGVPNNSPRVLHKRSRRWTPLFPARVTAGANAHFVKDEDAAAIAKRLERMRQRRLAAGNWLNEANEEVRSLILVLASLGRGPRGDEAVSRKTGLTVLEVRHLISKALDLGWIDEQRHLTDRGQVELAHARKNKTKKTPLSVEPEEPYYPTSLRAPRRVSS